MRISAQLRNSPTRHEVVVRTGDAPARPLTIGPKPGGGSSVNGGEMLMLALATCYCNDLYREAARLQIAIDEVEVEASATFAGIGLAAQDVRYHASVRSGAPPAAIAELLRQTDAVAEVHKTLRGGTPVTFEPR